MAETLTVPFILRVPCSRCNAELGTPCHNAKGKELDLISSHIERWYEANRAYQTRDAIILVDSIEHTARCYIKERGSSGSPITGYTLDDGTVKLDINYIWLRWA